MRSKMDLTLVRLTGNRERIFCASVGIKKRSFVLVVRLKRPLDTLKLPARTPKKWVKNRLQMIIAFLFSTMSTRALYLAIVPSR